MLILLGYTHQGYTHHRRAFVNQLDKMTWPCDTVLSVIVHPRGSRKENVNQVTMVTEMNVTGHVGCKKGSEET